MKLKNGFRFLLGFSGALIWFLLWGVKPSLLAQEPQPGASAASSQPPPIIEENKNYFTINFKDVGLEQIVKVFSDLTGKNFILEQIPQGKITIVSPVRMPKNQALPIFEAILNLNGYNIVPTSISNLYRIVPLSEALKSNLPIYLPGEAPKRAGESYIVRFIPLEYLNAQDAATLVGGLLSKDSANAFPYLPTNTLIVVDTAFNIQRILRVLKALDVPTLQPEMEIVSLKYSSATEMAGILNQIFGEQAGGKAPGARLPSAKPSPQPSGAGSVTVPQLKIIPEERLNSLILIADRATLDSVKKVISQLDIQAEDKGIFHVYYCKNAVARELASTLSSLAGGGAGIGPRTSPSRTSRTSSSERGGTTGLAGGVSSGVSSGGASSAMLSGGMFEGEIKITADEPTNSLLIIASPRDYEVIKQVLELLDIPRRQVFVEAVLLEVSLDQTRQLGTSIHGASTLEKGGAVFGTAAPGGLNSLTLLSLFSQGVQLPSGVTIGALGKPITISGATAGATITVPSAGVLLQMLASDSNVNVLSTPNILTTDNEEAEIQVGKEIPVPTGQTVATGGLSSISISRERVGIKLKLLPQINESGTIRLEISVEISNAEPSALGINVNTLGVTTSIKTASTTVIVKDTQTIIIGGLMEDRRSSSLSRFPFLGDIPFLGWLFKSSQKTKTKTNLIMLLTPHIVRSDEDVYRLREKFKKDYDSFIEESLGKELHRWDQYFETQYGETFGKTPGKTEATIDFTGEKPKVIEPAEEPAPSAQPETPKAPEKPEKKKWWKSAKEKSPEKVEEK